MVFHQENSVVVVDFSTSLRINVKLSAGPRVRLSRVCPRLKDKLPRLLLIGVSAVCPAEVAIINEEDGDGFFRSRLLITTTTKTMPKHWSIKNGNKIILASAKYRLVVNIYFVIRKSLRFLKYITLPNISRSSRIFAIQTES